MTDQPITPTAEQAFKATHRHYKGGLYQKLYDGHHTETREPLTAYRSVDGAVHFRPKAMFDGKVEIDAGEEIRRFRPLTPEQREHVAAHELAPTIAAPGDDARASVCAEIMAIMTVYDEQEKARGYVDTPGGLEHMGDVWRLFESWRGLLSAAPATPTQAPDGVDEREIRQAKVAAWCIAAFGAEQSASLPQRGIRLLEEAIETAQAAGSDRDMAHKLVDYVYDRPIGDIAQELGGVQLCALALASAAGLNADTCEANEVLRVLSKPLAQFAARNQAKNDAGFLSSASPVKPT